MASPLAAVAGESRSNTAGSAGVLAADVVVRLRVDGDDRTDQLAAISANARNSLRTRGAAFLPLIVLTEGASDAELVRDALHVLFPHLTVLVRFLDFDALP